MFEDLVRSGNMGRWWGAARRTKESFCSISTHSLHLLLRSFQLWFDLDWYELPPLLHIPNDDTSSSFGTMAPLYLVVYCRLCLKKWNNKNNCFLKGPQDWIWILAELTRVTGVTDDHLQEAGPPGWSFAWGQPLRMIICKGQPLRMIICKRPAPLDDYLQEAGHSRWWTTTTSMTTTGATGW